MLGGKSNIVGTGVQAGLLGRDWIVVRDWQEAKSRDLSRMEMTTGGYDKLATREHRKLLKLLARREKHIKPSSQRLE